MIDKCIENRNKIEDYLKSAPAVPVTEQSNYITKNIDLSASGRDILKLLAKTDDQIFNGWRLGESDEDSLKTDGLSTDLHILNKLNILSDLLEHEIRKAVSDRSARFKFILSGCGTSGRLAYLCSQTFNEYFRNNSKEKLDYDICDYIIAGDDYAIVNSVESVEDKPKIGAEKLVEKIQDSNLKTRFIYIGITCGLSAPFVAGQIDYCLNEIKTNGLDSDLVAFGIIGFNPVELARKTNPINDQNENFYDLIIRMNKLEQEEPRKCLILNPLIGPEPITGSSRMKSGTCTKVMLDLVTSKAISKLFDQKQTEISDMLEFYQRLLKECVYSEESIEKIGNIIDLAADSLKNLNTGGSINYLCDSERLGLLCCVDASECVPTYGAQKRDIKGFISSSPNSLKDTNTWNGFLSACSTTMSHNITENLEEFKSPNCLFILFENDEKPRDRNRPNIEEIRRVLDEKTQAKKVSLDVSVENKNHESIRLTNLSEILNQSINQVNIYFAKCLQEFVLKLCLNAISTGAHVLIGKTYENIMIDVRTSNIKLYYRAIGILKKFAPRSSTVEECENALLASIFSGENVPDIADKNKIEEYIEIATSKEYVVPKALIMLITKLNYKETSLLIEQSKSSVRNLILKLKSENQE